MNRLCVAISRARCGLYLFGNHAHLAKASKRGWKVVSDFMWKKRSRGSMFPFCDRPKPARHTESNFEGSFPIREKPGTNVTIHANQATVNVGGDNSVNTITTPPGNSSSGVTPPRQLEMPFPGSGKTPVHDPKSPTPQSGYPSSRMEGGDLNVDSSPTIVPGHGSGAEQGGKDARTPTQVTPEEEKSSLDLSSIEKAKERPIQESEDPKSSITDMPVTDQEYLTAVKEARVPTHATLKEEKSSFDFNEMENMKEKPVQESENPKNSIAGTPATEDEGMKEKPVQESEEPKEKKDEAEGSVRRVFHESDLVEFIKDKPLEEKEDPSGKEPTVETEGQRDNSSEQPLQEQGCEELDKDKPVQETRGPSKVQGTEVEKTRQIKEGEEAHEELSEGKPLQESASSEVETESWKEEALPTQETKPAGKGPFEETGQGQGTEAEKTKQIKEGEEVHEELSEGKPLQEIASSEVETESWKEEALPTQETMAAGKGPFEETGLEVGTKGQPTDEQD